MAKAANLAAALAEVCKVTQADIDPKPFALLDLGNTLSPAGSSPSTQLHELFSSLVASSGSTNMHTVLATMFKCAAELFPQFSGAGPIDWRQSSRKGPLAGSFLEKALPLADRLLKIVVPSLARCPSPETVAKIIAAFGEACSAKA